MNFRDFLLTEETYGLGIVENIKQFTKDPNNYIIFSNSNKLEHTKIVNSLPNLNGIIGYPAKYVYWTLKKERLLNIHSWSVKPYIHIVNISKGQILNIKEYEKSDLYPTDQEKLKKYFLKNVSPKNKNPEKTWEVFVFTAAKKHPKSCFKRLMKLMKEISQYCECSMNLLFKEIGYTAIYSDKGFKHFHTENPEICFLNKRNLKSIEVLENI